MTKLSGYIYLLLTKILGIVTNGLLKYTNGFTNIVPTVFCITTIILAIFFMAKAMNVIPVGFTYDTYVVLTITAVTVFGVFQYNQIPNLYGIIGIVLHIIVVILFDRLCTSA